MVIYSWFTHKKWWISTAMLVIRGYIRVVVAEIEHGYFGHHHSVNDQNTLWEVKVHPFNKRWCFCNWPHSNCFDWPGSGKAAYISEFLGCRWVRSGAPKICGLDWIIQIWVCLKILYPFHPLLYHHVPIRIAIFWGIFHLLKHSYLPFILQSVKSPWTPKNGSLILFFLKK